MNRALITFLAFCAAMFVLFGALAWWLGAPLLSLAFDSEQRAAPFHVIYMSDSVVEGEATPGAMPYPEAFDALLSNEGAQRLWLANEVTVPAGEVADEWQQVRAVVFATGSGFVRLVTGGDYRTLGEAAPGGRRSVFGLAVPPLVHTPPAELLLIAAELPDGDVSALLATFQPALEVGGSQVWASPMVVLEGEDRFNYLLVLGFGDAQRIDEWLSLPATETDLALVRAQIGQLTLWRLGGLTR